MTDSYDPFAYLKDDDDPEPERQPSRIMALGAIIFGLIGLAFLATGEIKIGTLTVLLGLLLWAGERTFVNR